MKMTLNSLQTKKPANDDENYFSCHPVSTLRILSSVAYIYILYILVFVC